MRKLIIVLMVVTFLTMWYKAVITAPKVYFNEEVTTNYGLIVERYSCEWSEGTLWAKCTNYMGDTKWMPLSPKRLQWLELELHKTRR